VAALGSTRPPPTPPPSGEGKGGGAILWRDAAAVLRTYAQILYSRSLWVGLLLLLATAASPRSLVHGLLAVVVALLSARLLDLAAPAAVPASVLPAPLDAFLHSLGGLFFLPCPYTGALVFSALVLHSRIAALLAGLVFASVHLLGAHLLSLPAGASEVLAYN